MTPVTVAIVVIVATVPAPQIQPYWKALTLKEQGNALYKESRFDAAVDVYTQAIATLPCPSVDLALTCYSNRAACQQQMREPEGAITTG